MANYLVITGGSRGIGKAAIQVFMKHGWEIINISRSNCDIAGVRNFNIDLSKRDWVNAHEHDLKKSIENADKICLVHNASIFEKDDITTMAEDSLRNVLEFNLVSTLSLNKLFIPSMGKGSAVIYIGSTLSEIGVPGRASYVISKHALVGMMRATCQDLSGQEITSCCICPGFVETSMLTEQVDKAVLDAIVKRKVTAGRLIVPHEIAELIYFCAVNPVMNGSLLHANLGQITT